MSIHNIIKEYPDLDTEIAFLKNIENDIKKEKKFSDKLKHHFNVPNDQAKRLETNFITLYNQTKHKTWKTITKNHSQDKK